RCGDEKTNDETSFGTRKFAERRHVKLPALLSNYAILSAARGCTLTWVKGRSFHKIRMALIYLKSACGFPTIFDKVGSGLEIALPAIRHERAAKPGGSSQALRRSRWP